MINQKSLGHIVIQKNPLQPRAMRSLCLNSIIVSIYAFGAYHSQNPYPTVHPGNSLILLFAAFCPRYSCLELLELPAEKLSHRSNNARNFPSFSCKSSMASNPSQQPTAFKALNHIVDHRLTILIIFHKSTRSTSAGQPADPPGEWISVA